MENIKKMRYYVTIAHDFVSAKRVVRSEFGRREREFSFLDLLDYGRPNMDKSAIIPLPPSIRGSACGVYVVSLAERFDRHENIAVEMRKANLPCSHYLVRATKIMQSLSNSSLESIYVNEFGLRYSMYEDWVLDPKADGYEEPEIHGVKIDNFFYRRPMTRGEVGCAISHHRIWMDAYFRDLDHVIIFEDDVVIRNGSISAAVSLDIPDDYDMLYIGRSPMDESHPHADRCDDLRITRPSFSYNLHAYVLSRSGVTKLIEDSQFHRNLIPVDEFVPALYAESPRSDIRQLLRHLGASRMKAFALDPNLADQIGRDAGSDIEGIGHFTGRTAH
eukprot:g210.t1